MFENKSQKFQLNNFLVRKKNEQHESSDVNYFGLDSLFILASVDIFAIKGARTLDVHRLLDVVESYGRVILMLVAMTPTIFRNQKMMEMQMRHAGSRSQSRTNQKIRHCL